MIQQDIKMLEKNPEFETGRPEPIIKGRVHQLRTLCSNMESFRHLGTGPTSHSE